MMLSQKQTLQTTIFLSPRTLHTLPRIRNTLLRLENFKHRNEKVYKFKDSSFHLVIVV